MIRPTRAEISTEALKHNFNVVKDIVGNTKIMGIVKANAYGHGLVEVSNELVKLGVGYLGVAFVEEAVVLREAGIKIPILVLGAIDTHQIDTFLEYDVDMTGSSIEKIDAISQRSKALGKKANVHVKIDTGMGRIGVQWDRAKPFIKEVLSKKDINIKGVFTHYASSSENIEYTNEQLRRFNKVLELFPNKAELLVHCSNSGAVANNINDGFKSMVRTGLLLYGYSPIPEIQERLIPVMSFKTKVSYFKVLKRGNTVGYDMTYTLKRKAKILTLPVGYADGYARSLSNRGIVNIEGKEYPVVGRVCMDQMMVNIGMGKEYENGTDVELWGRNISLWDISKSTDRSVYELLCGVTHRVPRVLV